MEEKFTGKSARRLFGDERDAFIRETEEFRPVQTTVPGTTQMLGADPRMIVGAGAMKALREVMAGMAQFSDTMQGARAAVEGFSRITTFDGIQVVEDKHLPPGAVFIATSTRRSPEKSVSPEALRSTQAPSYGDALTRELTRMVDDFRHGSAPVRCPRCGFAFSYSPKGGGLLCDVCSEQDRLQWEARRSMTLGPGLTASFLPEDYLDLPTSTYAGPGLTGGGASLASIMAEIDAIREVCRCGHRKNEHEAMTQGNPRVVVIHRCRRCACTAAP